MRILSRDNRPASTSPGHAQAGRLGDGNGDRPPRAIPGRKLGAVVALAGLALIGLASLTGCNPLAIAYFLQPFEPRIPGEGPKLEDARVVVVATVSPTIQNSFHDLEGDLTREYVQRLRSIIKKVQVVDPQQVRDWIAQQPVYIDRKELAQAFEADYVIALDVEDFEVANPRNLGSLHGRAQVNTRVISWDHPRDHRDRPDTNQPKEATTAFETYDEIEFPRQQGPLPIDLPPPAFYNRFVKVLATEIAWHFTGRATGDAIQDTRGLIR